LHRAGACHLIDAFNPELPARGVEGAHACGTHAEDTRRRDLAREDAGENGTTAMAADRGQNLQDTFLNHVRKSKVPLTIFLVNGVKLQGVVTWFDNFCVLLRRDGHSQLVYKHAISTIMPGHPIQLFEGGEEPSAAEKA
jgi:host factor-I protein